VRFSGAVGVRRFITALLLAGTAVVASGIVAAPAFASPASDLATATNSARIADGLPALSVQADLTTVAQAWANQLAAANVLSHNAALRTQVSGWSVLGENVGMASDIPSVQAAFMASTPHRDNILDPRYTQMGVGSATSTYPSCGCQVLWVVVDFRRPASAGAVPPAVPAARTPAPKPAPANVVTAPTKSATPPATAHLVAATPAAATVVAAAPPVTANAGISASATASSTATALSTQLAATASPSATGNDPVGRMVTFATVVSQLNS
jgi:hypothetical protein